MVCFLRTLLMCVFGKLILIVVKDLVEVKIFAITTSYIVTTIWCYIVFGNTHVTFGCMSYTYVAGASIRIAEYTEVLK